MINLAGYVNCDEVIKKELEEAGINYTWFAVARNGEVPSHIVGNCNGWLFTRAWYYWVAESAGILLPFEDADKLHEKYGKDVRVAGHCGCPAPREWYNKPWHIGVGLYHVDTQEGLNELVKYLSIDRQGKDK